MFQVTVGDKHTQTCLYYVTVVVFLFSVDVIVSISRTISHSNENTCPFVVHNYLGKMKYSLIFEEGKTVQSLKDNI